MKKGILTVLFVVGSLIALNACGNNTTSSTPQSETNDKESQIVETETSKREEFDFSKLDWSVKKERVNGDLHQVLEYTNNSDFSIMSLKITFEQKAETTSEELTVFDEYIKEKDLKDSDVFDIYVVGTCELYTKQGETNQGSLKINDSSYFLKTEEQYALFEPNKAEVSYVDGESIFDIEYDFQNKKLKEIGEPKKAYDWPDSTLSKQIPKLNCDVAETLDDYSTILYIECYGCSQSVMDNYINECINMGFEKDGSLSYGNQNIWLNKEGYSLNVDYNENNKTIMIHIEDISSYAE